MTPRLDIDSIELLQDLVEARISAVLIQKRAAKLYPRRPDSRPLDEVDEELLQLYNADKALRHMWDDRADLARAEEENV